MPDSVEYPIKFGTAFSIDEFGFVGKGKIKVYDRIINLSGKKHWSPIARFAVYMAITVIPFFLFKIALGVLPALVVIHYFCASPGFIEVNFSEISEVNRSNRKISFKASVPPGGKSKKSLFQAADVQQAQEIEKLLNPTFV